MRAYAKEHVGLTRAVFELYTFLQIKERNMKDNLSDIPIFYCRGAWDMDTMSFKDRILCNLLSGTNFERPAFKRMLNDLESHKANLVIVKDLSRFGREYAQMGMYIENDFEDWNRGVFSCFVVMQASALSVGQRLLFIAETKEQCNKKGGSHYDPKQQFMEKNLFYTSCRTSNILY